MKNKKRLKICRKQRERLAILSVNQSREIAQLETKIKARDVESFGYFARVVEHEQSLCSMTNEIAELEQENERLKKAYDRIFKQHSDYVVRQSVSSCFGTLRKHVEPPLEPLPMRRWWKVPAT